MSKITQNTTDLRAILEAVNALPEAGGGSSGPFVTVSVTEGSPVADFETVVNISTGVEVTWVEPPKTHALYNGVRLPKIPEDALPVCPYCFIRYNGTVYELFMESCPWYYEDEYAKPSETTGSYRRYQYDSGADAWNLTESNDSNLYDWYVSASGWSLVYSSHDIPNGSADATDVYFEGTEPVPVD